MTQEFKPQWLPKTIINGRIKTDNIKPETLVDGEIITSVVNLYLSDSLANGLGFTLLDLENRQTQDLIQDAVKRSKQTQQTTGIPIDFNQEPNNQPKRCWVHPIISHN